MLTGPTSHSFISQRLRLHYVDWGNMGAPVLVLVHGGRDHCRSWDWIAQELRDDWHIVAPDLRGHGDSEWARGGGYTGESMVYDLAQLIQQLETPQVTLVAHSLGGNIALRYTGIYPEKVRKLVAIEGLGLAPADMAKFLETPYAERFRDWADRRRQAAGRIPRRYATLQDAYERMKEANGYLSDDQARHLTVHGASRNEDGTYSWKFDNHLNVWPLGDLPPSEQERLWASITCPTLLCYGEDSWASNPEKDGRARHFQNARVQTYANAGHWLHHDQFEQFVSNLRAFL